MNTKRLGWMIVTTSLVLLLAACGKPRKEITELQRKEAAHLATEAQFAMNMRDWTRAERVLTQIVQTVPDEGVYWTSLGAMRLKLGNRAGAQQAYQEALKAYEDEAAADKTKAEVEPWLKQVQVLAMLGRIDDARKRLDQVVKKFPQDRRVRAFVDGKQFDKMIADPMFKQGAL